MVAAVAAEIAGNVADHFALKESPSMARPGPQTQAKRQRELAKLEKRRAKEEKKALRKAQKKPNAEVDPD